jgi:3-deoxy-D-manno-octulosonate 8-phosphate phosphatase (KDO 8-P phosphatase)
MTGLDEEQMGTLRRCRLLVLDVDGCLTDGRIVYGAEDEVQRFHVHDGAALRWLSREGVRIAWITGRGCKATERRADELEIDRLLFVRGTSKRGVLERLQAGFEIGPEETVAMGDDLPDLALAARAGFFAVPADGRPEVRERADLVTVARGGEGAVRELAEHVLRAKGRWQAIVDAASR